MTTEILLKRFNDLASQVNDVRATRHHKISEYSGSYETLDTNLLLNWRVKVRQLLSMSCGTESEHYRQFVESEKPQSYRSSVSELEELNAVFMAAKDDYEGGYLNNIRNLVQAEVFSNEIEQARELLGGGYRIAAAVIAGVVLETSLRQLCSDSDIPQGKLDKMNADLAKKAIYSILVQKRITAIADIRNNAAHGHPDKFSDRDVLDMISYVEISFRSGFNRIQAAHGCQDGISNHVVF